MVIHPCERLRTIHRPVIGINVCADQVDVIQRVDVHKVGPLPFAPFGWVLAGHGQREEPLQAGGDELFGGYWRYIAGLLSQSVGRVPGVGLLGKLHHGGPSAAWRTKLSRFAQTVTDDPLESYLRLVSPTTPAIADVLGRPELRSAQSGNRFADIARNYFDRAAGQSLLSRLAYVDMNTVLVDDYLVKEDRMTMTHSLEGRFPFLDVDLAEYAFQIPDAWKVRGLTTKRILRQLVHKQGLPACIGRARKQGLDVPLTGWLRGPLAGRVRESLLPSGSLVKEYCQPRIVNQVVREHLAGVSDHGRLVWCLLTLATWLEWQRQLTSVRHTISPRTLVVA